MEEVRNLGGAGSCRTCEAWVLGGWTGKGGNEALTGVKELPCVAGIMGMVGTWSCAIQSGLRAEIVEGKGWS